MEVLDLTLSGQLSCSATLNRRNYTYNVTPLLTDEEVTMNMSMILSSNDRPAPAAGRPAHTRRPDSSFKIGLASHALKNDRQLHA